MIEHKSRIKGTTKLFSLIINLEKTVWEGQCFSAFYLGTLDLKYFVAQSATCSYIDLVHNMNMMFKTMLWIDFVVRIGRKKFTKSFLNNLFIQRKWKLFNWFITLISKALSCFFSFVMFRRFSWTVNVFEWELNQRWNLLGWQILHHQQVLMNVINVKWLNQWWIQHAFFIWIYYNGIPIWNDCALSIGSRI